MILGYLNGAVPAGSNHRIRNCRLRVGLVYRGRGEQGVLVVDRIVLTGFAVGLELLRK